MTLPSQGWGGGGDAVWEEMHYYSWVRVELHVSYVVSTNTVGGEGAKLPASVASYVAFSNITLVRVLGLLIIAS